MQPTQLSEITVRWGFAECNYERIEPKLFHPRWKCPAVGRCLRSRRSVAVVRVDSFLDFHALLRASTDTAVGATRLECRLCP